jgi:hypothetical protein
MVMAAPISTTEKPTGVIEVSAYPRVMHFSENRNAIAQDGKPLICVWPDGPNLQGTQCLDLKGAIAWRDAFSYTLDDHVVAAYEYRLVGAGGYRHLILYFKRK